MRLENSFFPHQEVRANPEYDVEGNKSGSNISVNHSATQIPDRDNACGIHVSISLDEENSDNPPYFFTISAYGVFTTETEDESLEGLGVQILIGAIRERLASISSRAPWGNFNLNIVPFAVASE